VTFVNEAVTDISDFVTKLFTFATANGWTQDELITASGRAAMHNGNNYVSFRWATSTPTYLGIYQALGYDGSVPGNNPDDSGNGAVSGTDATIGGQRRVKLTSTPLQWWGFSDGSTYVHAVVQVTATTYAHLGFGLLDKIGDWTGGEYAYGELFDETQSSTPATYAGQSVLLDGRFNNDNSPPSNPQLYAATIHVEGLPDEGGTSKWGVIMGNQPDASLGTDRASVARVLCPGGFRAGPVAREFGRFSANSEKGLVPLYPISVLYRNKVTATSFYFLGFMLDVRGMSLEFFAAGDTIVIGSDTWYLFPSFKRSSGTPNSTSGFQGIAYKSIP